MREILEFSVEGIGHFKVYAEPTFKEQRDIENEVASLYGSQLQLYGAQKDIITYEKKFADIKENELIPVDRAEDWATLKVLKSVMTKCLIYATLKFLQVSPKNINTEILTEEQLLKISEAHGGASEVFFRSKSTKQAV